MKTVNKREIYFMLTYTGSLLSRIIKRVTRRSYTHVSLGLDPGLKDVYSFGRKRPKNPIIAGFVREDIKDGVYKVFENTTCTILTYEVNEEQYKKIQGNIERFEMDKDSYRYNFLGLWFASVGLTFNRDKHYFCSEFVATILEDSDVELFDKPTSLVSPVDFMDCEELTPVYEGELSKLEPENMKPL